MCPDPRRVAVLGVGNILLQDEGVGVHVARALEERGVPAGVEVIDAGTAALDALAVLGEVDRLVVIDAVDAAGPPGAIYRFSPDDVVGEQQPPPLSLHDIGLIEALEMADHIGLRPRSTVVFGVVPAAVGWGLELSPPVAARVPELVDRVAGEIGAERRAGVPVTAAGVPGASRDAKGGADAHLRAQAAG